MSTEMVVPEAVDGVAVRREALTFPGGAGAMAMAVMPDVEFEERLASMRKGQDRIRRIQRELMIGPTPENPEGEDYGVIPGTKKPTLLKPGAEKICNVYRLVPTFDETWIEGDGETRPHLRVRMKCLLHVGDARGPVVGEGVGAANSWEKKHRWRRADRACPSCGSEGTVRRSTYPNKGGSFQGEKGWWCKACRTNWDDPREASILNQQTGDVENKDPYEVENTLLKMAKKRSMVDATLTATATSGLFTQDVEDGPRAPAETTASAQEAPDLSGEEWPNDPAAHERHGVEPAQSKASPSKAACPKCGKQSGPWRYAKDGKTHFCGSCKEPFGVNS